MSDPADGTPSDEDPPAPASSPDADAVDADHVDADDDTFDELRQAAGAVVASLKWLIDATERVIEDPAAFSQVVDSGRGVVEAFTSGFLDDGGEATAGPTPTDPDDRPEGGETAEPPVDS